jgi:Ca2+-binding EF-hand superfamily protein
MNSEDAIVDRENFAAYDRNSDGKLDRHEIHQWAIPDHADIAQEDTYKLFQASDDNGDKQLTVDEILHHQDLWLGSSATGYGQHLGHQHHDEGEL